MLAQYNSLPIVANASLGLHPATEDIFSAHTAPDREQGVLTNTQAQQLQEFFLTIVEQEPEDPFQDFSLDEDLKEAAAQVQHRVEAPMTQTTNTVPVLSCISCGSPGAVPITHSTSIHPLCTVCVHTIFKNFSRIPREVCFWCRVTVPHSFYTELLDEGLIDRIDLERFVEKLTWNFLLSSRSILYCPNPRCSSPIYTGGAQETQSCTFLQCSECSQELCKDCGRSWKVHVDKTCLEIEQSEDWWGWKEEKDKEGVEERKAKKCPKCLAVMEKNSGCKHMTCHCGHQFCWGCMKDWFGHQDCGYAEEEDIGFGLFD